MEFSIILNKLAFRTSYVVWRNQKSKKVKGKKEEGAEVQSNKDTKNKGKLSEIPNLNTQYDLKSAVID